MEHRTPDLVAQFIEDTPAPSGTAHDLENCCNAINAFFSESLANSERCIARPANFAKARTRVKPVAGTHTALADCV